MRRYRYLERLQEERESKGRGSREAEHERLESDGGPGSHELSKPTTANHTQGGDGCASRSVRIVPAELKFTSVDEGGPGAWPHEMHSPSQRYSPRVLSHSDGNS